MGKLIDWVLRSGGIAVCVCDADITRTNEERKKAFQAMKAKYAENKDVLICDSMPSIEFWFLIHYVNTSKYFKDSDAVIQTLRRHISDYDKSGAFLEKQQWVAEMSTDKRQTEACNRATLLGPDSESYSEIHHAIKLFTDTK